MLHFGWLLTSLEENEEIPKPTDIFKITLENENQFSSLLLLDISSYSEKYSSRKSIKKTLSKIMKK